MRKQKHFRWTALVILLIVAACLIRIGSQVKQYFGLQQQALALEAELDLVQEEYDAKQGQIELLNDRAYIERLARERLGMVKAGETVVLIVDPEKEAVQAAPNSEDVPLE